MYRYVVEDAREAGRLTAKVNAAEWIDRYLREELVSSTDVLSVGSGSGVIECALGKAFPGANVVCVEREHSRLIFAEENARRLRNVSFIQGDALAIPLPDSSFDLVFSRLLMQHVGNPQLAINEMMRVCKPGGRMLLFDLDGQLVWHFPEDTYLTGSIERVLNALSRRGFDPFVGRKLYRLAYRAGLEEIRVRIDPYHQIIGAIPRAELELWKLKLAIANREIAWVLGAEEAERSTAAFLSHLQQPDSMTYSISFAVTGRKAPR